jgi:predicted transcriptional regulator
MLQFFPIVLVAKKGKFAGVITKADLIESIVG